MMPYVPQPSSIDPTPACAGVEHGAGSIDFGGLTSVRHLDLTHQPSSARLPQTWHTPHGSRVSFVAEPGLDMLDVVLRFDAGSRLDATTPGLAATTLYMLDQGAGAHDAQGLAVAVEDLGAQLTRQVDIDHATLTLRCLATPAVRDAAVALVTLLLASPRFDAAALENIQSRLQAHLQLLADNPGHALQRTVYGRLFADHPYGSYVHGTPAGVAGLTIEDLRQFHRQAYSASNLDIAVVGNLSQAEAEQLTAALSAALPQGWSAAAAAPPAPLPTTRLELPGAGSGTQALLALPLPLAPTDDEYEAVLLGCDLLGSGASSRLMRELRERRGLSYDARATPVLWRGGGVLVIEWDVPAEYSEASRRQVLAAIACLGAQAPDRGELHQAIGQRTGRWLRRMARNDQCAAWLAEQSQRGLPADYLPAHLARLAQVTPQQLCQAARRWLDGRQASFFSVGPAVPQQYLPDPVTR